MLTLTEVAERLRVHINTASKLVNRKENPLPAIKIGSVYRITENDLAEFLAKHSTRKGAAK